MAVCLRPLVKELCLRILSSKELPSGEDDPQPRENLTPVGFEDLALLYIGIAEAGGAARCVADLYDEGASRENPLITL